MANNSIKGRFRNLYQEVEENLTEESKIKLKELQQLSQSALHDYRNKLLKLLEEEYSKIINNLSNENNISVAEVEYRMIGNLWDNYNIAIEKLNKSIHTYLTEEELNAQAEELLGPIINQSDEELNYWDNIRCAINGYDETDYEESEDEEVFDEEYSEEERIIDNKVFKIENILTDKLTSVIIDIEKKLNITGQVIDFFLYLYDLSKKMCFYVE